MSENIKMEDLQEQAVTAAAEQEASQEATEQDPLKAELDRVQKKEARTESEKAAYSLKKNAERARELGLDPEELLGFNKVARVDDEYGMNDDDAPMTMGMFKRMQQQNAVKSALQLTDDIPNETERELTKYHLQNSIKSTGNPSEDLNLARAIVNSAKNSQIIEEIARKVPAKAFSSASSAGLAQKEDEVELTRDEEALMRFGGLTREEVLKTRQAR